MLRRINILVLPYYLISTITDWIALNQRFKDQGWGATLVCLCESQIYTNPLITNEFPGVHRNSS